MGSLKLFDTVQFKLLDTNLVNVKDDYSGAFLPAPQGQEHPSGMGTIPGTGQVQTQSVTGQQGLLVRIAATHSGLITRNNGFYLPDRMKKGVNSFTENYGKPVLLHHNDHADPVGRIVGAAYRDTSGAIVDQYDGLIVKDKKGREQGKLTTKLIKDLCEGKMPFGMQVDVVCSMLRDSLLEEPSYDGLGYIELVANITDPEAIQKLLDGRYLTGSVGATTDAAVCSVCRQDWTDTGQCEHSPGGVYDGVKCFVIAGNLVYDEYSFVNVPADRHSRVLELNYNGVQDSVKIENKFHGKLHDAFLGFPQYDKENTMLTDKKDQVQDSTTPAPEDTTTVVDAAPPAEGTQVVEDSQPALEVSLIDRLCADEKLSVDEENKLYDELYAELVAAVNEGELILDKQELEDAKLSTEKRNSLKKSTFCGPGRSFPVPDCAHVTAARRLIGRAKQSSATKEKIMACVNRKAKAMGCGTSDAKKDAVQDSVTTDTTVVTTEQVVTQDTVQPVKLTAELMTVLDKKETVFSAEDNETLSAILKLLVEKIGKDSFTSALKQTEIADHLISEVEQALLDEIAKYEEEIGDLREKLEANRKEYTSLGQDFEGLQDSLVQEKVKTRKVMESHLSTLRTLRDSKVEQHDYTALSDSALQAEIDQVSKVVDMTKITDKLGDGMSRVPSGEVVPSPVVVQDTASNNQKSWDVASLEKIRDQFFEIRFSRGQVAAEAFLARMRREGKLPQE